MCDRILSGIKLTPSEIAAAIDNIDHNALTLEQMRGLLKFIPTEAEATTLRGHAELTKKPFNVDCERYMSEVMHILGVETKMKAMIFMKRFPICANYFVEGKAQFRSWRLLMFTTFPSFPQIVARCAMHALSLIHISEPTRPY